MPEAACVPDDPLVHSPIHRTTSSLTMANHWDHFLARWGYRRSEHRVEPGLYALGAPTADTPVLVTANYSLSFDALRSALEGVDAYILVLDTRGVNVWCAAGKGTFGTDELVRRIEATGLSEIVDHRSLILPQLGGAGVAAHEVKRRSGFSVEYGPVRAEDLPAYLQTRQATPEMRRVRFDLWDRLVLAPMEVKSTFLPMVIAAAVLFLIAGPLAAVGAVAAVTAGTVLFPILLPWLPTRDFSSQGFILGGLMALPFALTMLLGRPEASLGQRLVGALMYLLAMSPVTAFLALNFTGSTTFTSKSGVRREMMTYIRPMAWTFGSGLLLILGYTMIRWLA